MCKPMFVVNLKTGERMWFDSESTPEHCAAYGHFTNTGKASWFFNLIRENSNWIDSIEWDRGKYSVAVKDSDWVAPTKDGRH